MRILERGHRVAYEPAAVAYEEAHEMEGFSRRVRITAGNVEQLREIKSLIWPPRPFVLFCLLSHKTGRLLVPVFMLDCAGGEYRPAAANFPTTGCCLGRRFSTDLPY